MSSAAVYAPYMAIVPTSLLQFADGATSQGFSTLYDLKLLNTFADDSAVGGVVDADGNLINLNVAQYLAYNLSIDGLHLENPTFERILNEAVAHSS